MADLRPQKRVRCSEGDVGRDRLSEMPDDVLVNILSLMPALDAVRTVLLRRFGNLWTLIHNLQFDSDDIKLEKVRVRRFVRNVLMLHQKPYIDRFDLDVEFDNEDERDEIANDIKIWFRFALDRQAKEISLSDQWNYDTFTTTFLPKLTSQFLVTLNLAYYKFEGEIQVKLGSLKKLSLTYVELDDEKFQSFISGCPSLQELFIENPLGMANLSFLAPNIDKLSLILDEELHWENSLALNIPNVKSFYLDIYMGGLDITPGLHIIDISSVRDIYVEYYGYRIDDDEALSFTTKLLRKFECVEVFRLSGTFSKIFLRVIQNLQLERNRWKRITLELDDDFCKRSLLGIYHLMRSLKHFEELIIDIKKDFKASTDLRQVELSPPYVPPQLKTVTLHGYGKKAWKSQLLLIESLLKSAAVLDKLVIVPMKHQLKEVEELEFVKQVSSLPKASSSARVIFR